MNWAVSSDECFERLIPQSGTVFGGPQPQPSEARMAGSGERREKSREFLASIDRRTWQLWALSLSLTASLAAAFAALFYPALKWNIERFEIERHLLPQLVLGLLTLLFLAGVYIVTKQHELNELRNFIITTYAGSDAPTAKSPRDALTGLLDRRALPEILERESLWVKRYGIPLCLVLFDIRGFGEFNQKQGNLAGDVVLKEYSRLLRATARQTDTILRHGADEFLCFLPRTDLAGAAGFAHRVSVACQENNRLRDLTVDTGMTMTGSRNPEAAIAAVERDLAGRKQEALAPQAKEVIAFRPR